jgi:hypothetical protein
MTYATSENFLQPVLQYDSVSGLWRLVEDYTFEWGMPWFRKRLFMAAGFEYDKASVPRWLWVIARHDGEWEAAALFHDRLYRDEGYFYHPESFRFETFTDGQWQLDPSRWKRKDMDELLRHVGVLGGANPIMARLYKIAVVVNPVNWFKSFN